MLIKRISLFFLVCFSCVVFSMCASAPAVFLTTGDNQKAFNVKKGDIIKISIEAQLSTGYGWQIASLSCVEQYGAIKVETAQQNITGGADLQHIFFRAARAGNGYIELKYVRPWVSSDAPLKIYKVFVSVKE